MTSNSNYHFERIFVKIVFEENIENFIIDVLSMPILYTVLSAIEMVELVPGNRKNTKLNYGGYFRFERSQDNNLKLTEDCNFELFEFAIEKRKTRKRKNSIDVPLIYEDFQRKISWSIMSNFQKILSMKMENEDCLCYTDGSVSNVDLFHSGLSYMKLFSHTNKVNHFKNLNYRNKININNHITVYFNIANYYKLKLKKNISQISVIDHDDDSESNTDLTDIETFNNSDDIVNFRKKLLCYESICQVFY